MELNLSDMLFAVVNFLIMAFLLQKILFKPVTNILAQRQQQVEAFHNQAKLMQKEAEDYRCQSEAKIEAANKSAQEIINQAVKAGEESKNFILEEARESANSLLNKARTEMEYEKEKMKEELRNEVAVLSVMAAGKLLNKAMTPKDHENLIQEFIADYAVQKELEKSVYIGAGPLSAEISSAVALTDHQQRMLEKNLTDKIGTKVELKLIENKELVGGLVIKIGDVVINGSVANKMTQMQEQLLQA